MKKIAKLTAGLMMAALTFASFSCKKGTDGPGSGPVEIPKDAVRFYTEDSTLSELSVYGVEDLEKLAEIVNEGDDFEGMTVTVQRDFVINKNLLTDNFLEPEEGPDATPNPNFKNLDSIGSRASTAFKGTFDGNGKVISGLYIYQGHQGLGFIGSADGATIKNVIIVDACVINKNTEEKEDGTHDGSDDDRFGGLVGLVDKNKNGITIENCLFAGVVGSQAALDRGSPYEYIGGLLGRTEVKSYATDCYVFARTYGSQKNDAICGEGIDNLTQTNVTGVEINSETNFEDLAAQIADAIATIKANLQ